MTSHRDATGMKVRIRGIIPKWPQISGMFTLTNYYNSAFDQWNIHGICLYTHAFRII